MKMMRQKRSTVARLGFSLVKEGALIYKLPLMGFCKLKVQLNMSLNDSIKKNGNSGKYKKRRKIHYSSKKRS
jgi:hypothetical protein